MLDADAAPEAYDWKFLPEAGKSFSDSGTQACHGLVAPAPGLAPPG